MYAFTLPSDIARWAVSPLWNLGELCYTHGLNDYIRAHGLELGYYLMRHLAGDYGVAYDDTRMRDLTEKARRDGQPFASVFRLMDHTLSIVTVPSLGQTILDLSALQH